jgi:ABC-type protease/lipase transport system fused ATPase/permease subunit
VAAGVWPAATGSVRLDGARLEDWPRAQLGPAVGYLPQDVELFPGSVADNIARFAPDADPEAIVAAATLAGVHELILSLPDGYASELGPRGTQLSGGQRQRIALARALYDNPKLLVLDEPNANLDQAGEMALCAALEAIKARGVTVALISHRPQTLRLVDKVLVLNAGRQMTFGARDEVLAMPPALAAAPPAVHAKHGSAMTRPAPPAPMRASTGTVTLGATAWQPISA